MDYLATLNKFVEYPFDQRTVEMSGHHNHMWGPMVIPNGCSRNEVTTNAKCGGRHEEAPAPFPTHQFQDDCDRTRVLGGQIVLDCEGLKHDVALPPNARAHRRAEQREARPSAARS